MSRLDDRKTERNQHVYKFNNEEVHTGFGPPTPGTLTAEPVFVQTRLEKVPDTVSSTFF